MERGALRALVRSALDRRAVLFDRAKREGTDCIRLVHGVAEGAAGLTVDRYGSVLLVQTRHMGPWTRDDVDTLADEIQACTGWGLEPVWNVRGAPADAQPCFDEGRACTPSGPNAQENEPPFIGRELGLRFDVRPRHRGRDPLLFLDFRVARRHVRAIASGRSVLNLFAYTCGIGVAACAAGASEVWNVDFARSALEVGRVNATLNGLDDDRFVTVQADVLPTLRQLAGLPVKGRGARRAFARFESRMFDLVVLDPPRWATSPFGAVDVVRDYPSLLKPALMATAPGGIVLASHHVPGTSQAEFAAMVRRTVDKVGRSLRALEILGPEEDFPSFDGEPPFKLAVLEVD